MATVIIFTIIFTFIFLWLLWDDLGDGHGFFKTLFVEYYAYILPTIICIFLGGFFGVIISWAIPNEIEIVKTEYKIETLQDNSAISGSFILGTGSINEKMYYVYYYEEDGYYKMDRVVYNQAKVKYTDECPKLVIIKELPIATPFSLPYPQVKCPEYIFYIPEGSIIQEYRLDAKF